MTNSASLPDSPPPLDPTLLSRLASALLQKRLERDPTRIPLSAPQQLFHAAQEPERILAGGNGSGKTFAGVREARLFAEGRHPFRPDVTGANMGWIVSLTFPSSTEVIEPYLGVRHDPMITPIFPPGYGEWSASRRTLKLPDPFRSSIGLMSCDAGALKFQGAKKRWVMFDEEPPLDIYQEAGARLAPGQRLDRWICMTPTQGMSWTHDDFVLKPVPGRHFITFAELASNPGITAEQVAEAEKRYERDPLKDARLAGHFVSVGLRPAFPSAPLQKFLNRTPQYPSQEGFITAEGTFEEMEGGELSVWELPRPGLSYVIGADVAEGLAAGAYSAAVVLRLPDRRQVALWRDHIAPIPYGRKLARLGRFYNEALVNPEANNHGHATIAELVDGCDYRNVYKRRTIDRDREFTSGASTYGFYTGTQSKALLEQLIVEAISTGTELFSPVLIRELLGASRDMLGDLVKGRGLWLDTVIALGLALVAAREQRYAGWPALMEDDDSIEGLRARVEALRAEREEQEQAASWGGLFDAG